MISSSVASGGGAALDAATDGGTAAGAAPCLMSHCCTKGGMVLSERKAPLLLSIMSLSLSHGMMWLRINSSSSSLRFAACCRRIGRAPLGRANRARWVIQYSYIFLPTIVITTICMML